MRISGESGAAGPAVCQRRHEERLRRQAAAAIMYDHDLRFAGRRDGSKPGLGWKDKGGALLRYSAFGCLG